MMKRNQIISERLRQNNGFTLIEAIAVLVIIAIVSAVVVVRGMSTEDVNLQVEADTLKSHLRYAQYLAMNDTDITNPAPVTPILVKWGIQINGQSYTLVRNLNGDGAAFDSPYILPNESSATHSVAPFTATVVNILFDEWGIPYIASAKLSTDATITLTPGPKSFTITAETGFIP